MRARLLSLLLHGIAIVLLVSVSSHSGHRFAVQQFARLIDTRTGPLIAPYLGRGGGGGGARAPLPAPRGSLPKSATRQFVPPSETPPESKPVLMMEAALVAPRDATLPDPILTRIGDPLGRIGPPSGGPGKHGGIGEGEGGGVGPHRGPGFGDRDGGGVSFSGSVGGRLVAPVVLYKVDPEFSEEARKAKYQGVVVLAIEVGADGKAHAIRVVSGLGLGLDEKAMEAVSQWKFKPAMRNGRLVTASATIEVNFRLL